MSDRRVRVSRQIYGRVQPLARTNRARVKRPTLSLLQRRLLILVVAVVLAVYGLLRLFAISNVVINSPARGAEIKATVLKLVHGSWQQGSLLTLDEDQLVSDLQQADPLVRSVEVRRKWFHTLRLSVVLKQPSMGWSSDNQFYLLDRDGTAIGMLPAGSKLPVVKDGSNLPVKLGQRVTTSRFVDFTSDLAPALGGAGYGVSGMEVKDTTLDLTVTTDKGYRLVFDTSRPVEEEIADLKAVARTLAAQKRTPAEYIDLRIAGKAYYK
jgi:cell division septal protein FtsQ